MKKYIVTMFRIVNKELMFHSVSVTCSDPAIEIWLNPQYKNIFEVKEII